MRQIRVEPFRPSHIRQPAVSHGPLHVLSSGPNTEVTARLLVQPTGLEGLGFVVLAWEASSTLVVPVYADHLIGRLQDASSTSTTTGTFGPPSARPGPSLVLKTEGGMKDVDLDGGFAIGQLGH